MISDGFITTQLPAASAGPSFQLTNMTGKFHGTICPTTPSGSGHHVVEEALLDRNHGALELVGHPAEVAERRSRALHVKTEGVPQRVPGVAGLEQRQALRVVLDGIGQFQQQPPTIRRGQVAPVVKRLLGRRDRAVDVLLLGLRDLREH